MIKEDLLKKIFSNFAELSDVSIVENDVFDVNKLSLSYDNFKKAVEQLFKEIEIKNKNQIHKYNINDKVYLIYNNKIQEGEIKKIEISMQNFEYVIIYTVEIRTNTGEYPYDTISVFEEDLASTKKEFKKII